MSTATAEAAKVEISREDLLGLFGELKFSLVGSPDNYPNARLIAKAKKNFPGLEQLPEISKHAHKTFDSLLEAFKDGLEIEVTGGDAKRGKSGKGHHEGNGKAPKAKKEKGERKPRAEGSSNNKMSCLDAAAVVLEKSDDPLTTKEMVELMGKKGLWSSPNGLTPAATLYSAILREIGTKGKDSRFKKTERGKFAAK